MIDLHLHLDGSLTPKDVILLAQKDNVALPTYDQIKLKTLLTAPQNCESLSEYLEKFALALSVLQSEENLSLAVYLVLKRLSEEGLIYVEIRFAPLLHTQKGMSIKTAVASAISGLKKACEEFNIHANLILCLMRIDGKEKENLLTVNVAKDFLQNGVCAIDLAGGEVGNPTEKYSHLFKLAKQKEIPFTIHAGEAGDSENVDTALLFGAKRIGHGVRCVRSDKSKALLKQNGALLELCYTSNLQTKAVKPAEEYPLKRFLDEGIKVSINTDNTTVSDTTLKDEYRKIKRLYSFENDTLKSICYNALDSAFIDNALKTKLKPVIEKEFENWIGV